MGKARKRVDSGMRKDLGLFVQSCYGRAVFASVPFVYWTAVPLPGASAIHLTGPLSLPSFAIKAACSKHSFTGLFVLKCVHPREGFQSWSFWARGCRNTRCFPGVVGTAESLSVDIHISFYSSQHRLMASVFPLTDLGSRRVTDAASTKVPVVYRRPLRRAGVHQGHMEAERWGAWPSLPSNKGDKPVPPSIGVCFSSWI